jgi:hypothetical protein
VVIKVSNSLRNAGVIVLLMASGCDPAASTAGKPAPSTTNTNESIRARQVARECVMDCDRAHARGSSDHLRCARQCLGARQGELDQRDADQNRRSTPPWGIVFAMTVSSALAVLAMLF